jgi:hypothetical protein
VTVAAAMAETADRATAMVTAITAAEIYSAIR